MRMLLLEGQTETRTDLQGHTVQLVPTDHGLLGVNPHRPAAQNPALVYLASLAPGSRRTMRQALDTVAFLVVPGLDAITCPWHELRFHHTTALRSKLAERFAANTTNKMLAALRGVLRYAFKLGLVDADHHARSVSIGAVRGTRLPRGRGLVQGELRALFSVCDAARPNGARDAALLAVLYAGGLRRSEAVALNLDNYRDGQLVVRGKGNKERLTFLTSGAERALAAWLGHRGTQAGPLFLPVTKGGIIEHRRMSDQAVLDAVRRIGRRAGVQQFSPHDLRRSFVSDLLDAGADISTVQQLAGHAQVTTTARYDRRGEATKKRAVELLHVPFG
jgi:site-specific recombinase XerD